MTGLRQVTPEDEEMIRSWRNLPEVAKYMYTDHFIAPEEHARWFKSSLKDPSRQYWIITFGGKDVGLANLYDIDTVNKRCCWAFYIADPQLRGKGLGTLVEYLVLEYVFETLNFNRLGCEVLSSNEEVIKMHEKFGFQREGCLRRYVIKRGQAQDVVYLGILREEWEAAREGIKQKLTAKGLI